MSEEKPRRVPLFGHGPAEAPSVETDILLDIREKIDYGFVDDEVWMDVIAEGKFDSSIPRQNHGNHLGGKKQCQCFLCAQWRRNRKATSITEERIMPLTNPDHPIFRKSPKSL